jgi:peptidoglycan/xylan/chitin deacetylase (PgdA/CDA1 family)
MIQILGRVVLKESRRWLHKPLLLTPRVDSTCGIAPALAAVNAFNEEANLPSRMNAGVPSYFTSLKPFTGLFATGVPSLMYHKLGRRPWGVRLKGLYLSRSLFERQLSQLHAAGFTTPAYGPPPLSEGNPGRRIVLTFDDGFANVFEHGLEPLAQYGFRAVIFLVADLIGGCNGWEMQEGEARQPLMDETQVKEWLAAGHEIGSHTLTHPFLTRLSLKKAGEEISASKKKLEDCFGRPIRHFCYPYGDWNPAVRDRVVAAGYETACTTEFGVNTKTTPPFELKRVLVRYQSISFKALKERLARARFR